MPREAYITGVGALDVDGAGQNKVQVKMKFFVS